LADSKARRKFIVKLNEPFVAAFTHTNKW